MSAKGLLTVFASVAAGVCLLVLASIVTPVQAANSVAYVWTERVGAGQRNWTALASSANGMRVAAAEASSTAVGDVGAIYTSVDGGVTWVKQTAAGSPRYWTGIASSADGIHLVAVDSACNVYISADGGVIWTHPLLPRQDVWGTDAAVVTSSSDGTHLAVACGDAGGPGGPVFTSADGGVTWTYQTSAGSSYWTSIASSADGTDLVAAGMSAATTSEVRTSIDSGVAWINHKIGGSYNGILVTSSADGTHLAAAVDDGDIYTSTDGGDTWVNDAALGTHNWRAIASSADGMQLAVAEDGGDIHTSTNGGATWTDQPGAGVGQWVAIANSTDGARLVAASNCDSIASSTSCVGGHIYTAVHTGAPNEASSSISFPATTAQSFGSTTGLSTTASNTPVQVNLFGELGRLFSRVILFMVRLL